MKFELKLELIDQVQSQQEIIFPEGCTCFCIGTKDFFVVNMVPTEFHAANHVHLQVILDSSRDFFRGIAFVRGVGEHIVRTCAST